jgi:hypothetical protein
MWPKHGVIEWDNKMNKTIDIWLILIDFIKI